MRCRGEGAARNVDQESRCGPYTDSRHAGQDRVKRVSKHEPLNFLRHWRYAFTDVPAELRNAFAIYRAGIKYLNHSALIDSMAPVRDAASTTSRHN
jgi:hypothetical protein